MSVSVRHVDDPDRPKQPGDGLPIEHEWSRTYRLLIGAERVRDDDLDVDRLGRLANLARNFNAERRNHACPHRVTINLDLDRTAHMAEVYEHGACGWDLRERNLLAIADHSAVVGQSKLFPAVSY